MKNKWTPPMTPMKYFIGFDPATPEGYMVFEMTESGVKWKRKMF